VSSLSSNNVQYGRIWFDVETNPSTGCGWGSTANNCAFMQSLVSACASASCGVYASASMWTSIMGSSCTVASSLPLWYPQYQTPPVQNFTGFHSFGNWQKPTMKQYQGDATVCGFGVDNNWMP
jgi:hypothetical protein